MNAGRRPFLLGLLAALFGPAAFARSLQRRQQPFPRGQGIPDASSPGMSGAEVPSPRRDPRPQLKENQEKLRRNAGRLLELAEELKDEAEKTNQTEVLSLSLIQRAEEIEKLAKQIKSLARAT